MATRELSSTLRNLKFMQRAAQREEKPKKEEEEEVTVKPDTVNRKCLVIMEGDPHPGAVKGRMSFQNFNPSVDKMNEEAENLCPAEAPGTSSNAQAASFRENGSSLEDGECSDMDKRTNGSNGDLKRKQAEDIGQTHYPNKSPRNGQSDQKPSPSNSRSGRKQSKQDKLDWSVLRPPKGQKRKE